MKRKLILTITIAALLCILFAFTVSASNYIDISELELGYSSYLNASVYTNDACSCGKVNLSISEVFGIIEAGDYSSSPCKYVYGFCNVEFWHRYFFSHNVDSSDDIATVLNFFVEKSYICNCSTIYFILLECSEGIYQAYVNYLDSLHIGYEEGYHAGLADGYDEGREYGYHVGEADGYDTGYDTGFTDGENKGYSDGYYDGETDTYDAAADYVENWFTLQGLKQYIAADETLPSKDIFEYEFNHNSVAFKEATYSAGETDGLNASGIAKEGILSIVSAPFYFLSGIFNFEIFGVNLFSIISVILTLAVVAFFFKKIKG